MIYKAATIQAHHVATSISQNIFFPTDDFGSSATPSDLLVLSQFNEDQSMMSQCHSADAYLPSRNRHLPFTDTSSSLMTPNSAAECLSASHVPLTSPRPCFEPSYTTSDLGSAPFQEPAKNYEVSPRSNGYDTSHGGETNTFVSPYFHTPMIDSSVSYSSPPNTPSVPAGGNSTKEGLRIRMSQPCYEMGQRYHEVVPLETNPFKK
jgi:hypothetical protein